MILVDSWLDLQKEVFDHLAIQKLLTKNHKDISAAAGISVNKKFQLES